MTPYGFLRSLRLIFMLGIFVLAGVAGLGGFICHELATESKFRSRYGATWRAEYEQAYGPVANAHVKVAASAIGLVAQVSLIVWLSRLLRTNHRSGRSSPEKRRKHRQRYRSELERASVFRRNAVLGIYLGVVGVGLGILLVLFRVGIFAQHSNEIVLGIFVFLAGYCGVLAGCGYWLKAKQWNEALVVIGLMPLGILLIPFVRLIFLASPLLLPVAMTMMSLILIVVVWALPDRSGASRRKPRCTANRSAWSRLDKANPRPEPGSSTDLESS